MNDSQNKMIRMHFHVDIPASILCDPRTLIEDFGGDWSKLCAEIYAYEGYFWDEALEFDYAKRIEWPDPKKVAESNGEGGGTMIDNNQPSREG